MNRVVIAFVVFVAFAGVASAAEAPLAYSERAREVFHPLPHQILKDTIDLGTAPLHWNRMNWLRLGEGVALILVAYSVDKPFTTFISHQQNHIFNSYLKVVTQIGDGAGLGIAALAAGGGFYGRDDRLMDAGIDALESTGFAAGIAAPVVKVIIGRARPIFGQGTHSFHPFDPAFPSFPSGHTTNAFAIATSFATRYDDSRWVPILAYTLATSVAVARVHDKAHYTSDVVAGALVGRAVAKSIVNNHRRAKIAVIPTGSGVIVDLRF